MEIMGTALEKSVIIQHLPISKQNKEIDKTPKFHKDPQSSTMFAKVKVKSKTS